MAGEGAIKEGCHVRVVVRSEGVNIFAGRRHFEDFSRNDISYLRHPR